MCMTVRFVINKLLPEVSEGMAKVNEEEVPDLVHHIFSGVAVTSAQNVGAPAVGACLHRE